MIFFAAIISLITCHGGPAEHFAVFAEHLKQDGVEVEIYASGPAIKRFEEKKITTQLFDPDDPQEATRLAKSCMNHRAVLTDMGHSFDVLLHQALAREAPNTLRMAYYDNREPYVPGGYSETAAKVAVQAQKILFANANLATRPLFDAPGQEIPLSFEKRIALGYYPLEQVKKLTLERKPRPNVLVYFGGNNSEYFEKAFPSFLALLAEGTNFSDFSKFTIIIQQHPGAKLKNVDLLYFNQWEQEHRGNEKLPKIVFSTTSSEELLRVADRILYYQTSMSPLFALAEIPSIQIGHESFRDLPVQLGLFPSITRSEDLARVLETTQKKQDTKTLFDNLGIDREWFAILKNALSS